jgi:hypothetical protein
MNPACSQPRCLLYASILKDLAIPPRVTFLSCCQRDKFALLQWIKEGRCRRGTIFLRTWCYSLF